jgi:pyruvate formate lyase activating enzyme
LVHQADQARCRGCGACLAVCCYGALDLPGKSFTPRGLYEKIRGDLRYFLLEGEGGRQEGGITFSGGEPMLYAGFIRSFCDLIPGVHRAMETSGHAPRKWFEDILESIDLFLFDYKISNPEKHRRYCGADNALILSNLDFLYSRGKAIVLRFPIIPKINDDDEHFDGIAGLLRRYPAIGRGEIMAYHNLGIGKAEELGMEYPKELPLEGAGKEMAAVWMERLRSRGCANVYQS